MIPEAGSGGGPTSASGHGRFAATGTLARVGSSFQTQRGVAMGFIDTLEQYIRSQSSSQQRSHTADQVDLWLPLDEADGAAPAAFRTASSAPFGNWWSASSGA